MLVALGHTLLAGEKPATTVEEVWESHDPRKEPLEIGVTKHSVEHGSILTEFTFTGMAHEGSKVRVYALFSVPEGKEHLPGILHIHGDGQTVNPQWLRFWNERGHAALTFNWGGAWPNRDRFTDWGKLTQCNHKDAGAMAMATEPSVRASSWYLWTRVSGGHSPAWSNSQEWTSTVWGSSAYRWAGQSSGRWRRWITGSKWRVPSMGSARAPTPMK